MLFSANTRIVGRFNLAARQKLNNTIKRTKVEYVSGNSYNKRWHYKWRHAYYGVTKDQEHSRVQTPEEAKLVTPYMGSWIGDWQRRVSPGLQMAWSRKHRMMDNFSCYALPGFAFASSLFWDLGLGFKILTVLPLATLYVRIRDKTPDPDIKETYLREMIYNNEEIAKHFNDETIHVLDYDMEYEQGFPCAEKYPEFSNKIFRFFNTDTSMCKGHFVFGDVESGAMMRVDIKTMPIPSNFRYNVGEPFFYYDVRAQINNNGVYSEVVLVDEAESLKKYRPYLFLW